MSSARDEQLVLRLLRMAADSQPVPAEGHFVEDEELLTCWSLGLLSAEQQQEMIDHLGVCPSCRRTLAEMLRDGVLEGPESTSDAMTVEAQEGITSTSDDEVAEPPATLRPGRVRKPAASRRSEFGRQIAASWRLAVAASLLVAIGAIWWALTPPRPGAVLALADRELQGGNARAALDRVDRLLVRQLDEGTRSRAEQLLQAAGYAAASKSLTDKDFGEVLEIDNRVSVHAGSTGRLENLRLQAERGIPSELALAWAGSLTSYGYELDGSSPKKSLPVVDETTERLNRKLDSAVTSHPGEVSLWLNRGQFLLTLARHEAARECFERARAIDPQNALAYLGLGLASFESRDLHAALARFEEAARLAPDQADVQVNLGICLTLLGRSDEAIECFRRAREATADDGLRKQIDEGLRRLEKR